MRRVDLVTPQADAMSAPAMSAYITGRDCGNTVPFGECGFVRSQEARRGVKGGVSVCYARWCLLPVVKLVTQEVSG